MSLLWWRKFLLGDVLQGRDLAPTLAPSLPGAPLAPRGPWGPGGPWTPRSPGKPLSPCRRGRKGAEPISGALGGQKTSGGRVGVNSPWHQQDRGHQHLRGHPVMEAEVAGVSAGMGTCKVTLVTGGTRGGAWCCPHSPAHRACQPHRGGQRGLADPVEEEEEEEVRRGEVSHQGMEVAPPPPHGSRPLLGRGDPLTWKPGAPAGPCSPLSPAGPWGRGQKREAGQGAPELPLQQPSPALGGIGHPSTHSRAGGTLGTSFTVFASSTLRRGGKKEGAQSSPATSR